MNKLASRITKIPLLLLLLFILTSCGFFMLPLSREKTQDFAIRGADFSKTFDTCIKAALDIGFDIDRADKPKGYFKAERGFGLDEVTELRFYLKKGYRRKLEFTVTVKSTRGSYKVMEDFVNSIENYLNVFPIESLEQQKR